VLSPTRLLLLSGTGGAGTSTVSLRLAEQSAALGLRTHLVDMSDARDRAAAREAATPWLGSLLAEAMLGQLADPLLPEELSALPGIDEFLALAAIADAADDESLDVLIVDAGPLEALERLLMLPATLELLAESLMTPEQAMVAGTGMLVELRAELSRIRGVLERESTTVRLVVEPSPDRHAEQLARIRRTLTCASLHEVTVDLVYANKVPRKSDDWPSRWAADRRKAVSALRGDLPVDVVRIPLRVRGDRMRLIESVADLRPRRRLPAAEVTARGERFAWSVPVEGCESAAVRVGRTDDRVIIDVGGMRRVRALPSVIRRCVIDRVIIDNGALDFDCSPDPGAWRSDG